MKLPVHRAGLAGHLPFKPVVHSTTRTITFPICHLTFGIHLNFGLWHFSFSFLLLF